MNAHTIAETNSEISLITNESLVYTFTEYIDKNTLYLFLLDELDKLEASIETEYSLVEKLNGYISLLPFASDEKEECEHRLGNMLRLYGIKETLNNMSNESINEDKVKEISALVKVSNHCPLRNLLEKKLNEFEYSIDKVGEEKDITLLDSLEKCKDLDELDNIICDLSIDEYINLGQLKRRIVAGKMFAKISEYKNEELFRSELYKIVSEVSNLTIETTSTNVLDAKNTVDVTELNMINIR